MKKYRYFHRVMPLDNMTLSCKIVLSCHYYVLFVALQSFNVVTTYTEFLSYCEDLLVINIHKISPCYLSCCFYTLQCFLTSPFSLFYNMSYIETI